MTLEKIFQIWIVIIIGVTIAYVILALCNGWGIGNKVCLNSIKKCMFSFLIWSVIVSYSFVFITSSIDENVPASFKFVNGIGTIVVFPILISFLCDSMVNQRGKNKEATGTNQVLEFIIKTESAENEQTKAATEKSGALVSERNDSAEESTEEDSNTTSENKNVNEVTEFIIKTDANGKVTSIYKNVPKDR